VRRKNQIAFLIVGLIILGILAGPTAMAQNVAPPSLRDQLEAQYQLAKMGPGSQGPTQPGTVLVIQKAGILGYPPGTARPSMTGTRYKDGSLHLPMFVMVPSENATRPLPVGEKVYVTNIDVNVKNEKITFHIVECDACNGAAQFSSNIAAVIFEFAKGYLETASVPDVEDTIGQVLAIYTPPTEAPPTPPTEQPAGGQAAPGQALTNDDIIKLVQLKLADSVIIAKIKSSACAFDTSVDGLTKLKQAGVSDAVLQAMVEAGGQPIAETPPQPAPLAVETPPAPACGDYAACLASGTAALSAQQWDQSLANLQKASTLDPAKPEAWAEMGSVYLATGQYQDAVAMWDRALQIGGNLQFRVLYLHGFSSEWRTFRLSAKEVSLVGVSSARPAEVSSVKSAKAPFTTSWYFTMKIGDKKIYRLYYAPPGVGCEEPARECNEPAPSQMETVANYVAQTMRKLAPGSLGK